MAKKAKSITESHSSGGTRGETTYYIWSNDLGETETFDGTEYAAKEYMDSREVKYHLEHRKSTGFHWEYIESQYNENRINLINKLWNNNYKPGIYPSNLEAIFEKLQEDIGSSNAAHLQSLLTTDFLYRKTHSHSSDNGGWSGHSTETWIVRPNVEALFFDNNAHFAKLIDLLLEKNDESLYTAFFKGLGSSDLYDPRLFSWDATVQSKTLTALAEVQRYGEKLMQKNSSSEAQEKGRSAIDIATSLQSKVQERALSTEPLHDQTNNYKTMLENLKFKLQVAKELHNNDNIMNVHRGWKRVIANVCSILLTAGIANLMHYAFTDRGLLFFDKTATQEKILKAHEAMFDPGEQTELDPEEQTEFDPEEQTDFDSEEQPGFNS